MKGLFCYLFFADVLIAKFYVSLLYFLLIMFLITFLYCHFYHICSYKFLDES